MLKIKSSPFTGATPPAQLLLLLQSALFAPDQVRLPAVAEDGRRAIENNRVIDAQSARESRLLECVCWNVLEVFIFLVSEGVLDIRRSLVLPRTYAKGMPPRETGQRPRVVEFSHWWNKNAIRLHPRPIGFEENS